ncbi:unnamed protein product [Lupinus luteus]|uniref:Uncharacterized protein n=1 Tax=Lupinus luteus TaxID=3873 RepID=A0AAV1VSR4_LUPLU
MVAKIGDSFFEIKMIEEEWSLPRNAYSRQLVEDGMNSDSENDISEGEVAWPEAMSGWGDGSSRDEDGDDMEAFPSRPSVPLIHTLNIKPWIFITPKKVKNIRIEHQSAESKIHYKIGALTLRNGRYDKDEKLSGTHLLTCEASHQIHSLVMREKEDDD